MMTVTNIHSKFTLGPLIPLHDLEGERMVISLSNIAVVSSSEARWLQGTEIKKLNLPQVRTKHARWINNGNEIGIAAGKIKVKEEHWETFPLLSQLDQYAPPGIKHNEISSLCWSEDGLVAVVVVMTIDEQGSIAEQRQIYLFDVLQNDWRFTISRMEVEDAIIVGNHVLLLAETISILNFAGEEIARLPASGTRPYRISMDPESNLMAILDNDWTIRLVDTEEWKVITEWKGKFKDVSIWGAHVIVLDMDNHLHAACFRHQALQLAGKVETGLLIHQIAIGEDDQLFLMGSGPVAVHKTRYSISCTE